MTQGRFRGLGFVAGVTAGAVLTVCMAAYAASTSITGGSIGTSANAQTSPCTTDTFTIGGSTLTRYVASGNRYEIAQTKANGVPGGCRHEGRITVLNTASPYNAVGNGNASPNDGAIYNASLGGNNTLQWTAGQGPLLNNIDSSSSGIDVLVIVRG